MKHLIWLALAFVTTGAEARPWQRDYPACDVAAQQHVSGGSGKAAAQAHIAMRANILQADIATTTKARPITAARSRQLWTQVDTVRRASERQARRPGGLRPADRARYDRQLDAVARQLCL